MADEERDGKKTETDRRDFLAQVGRLAVYTPPTVSMVLSVADKARAGELNTSYDPPTKTTSTTTTTTTITVSSIPSATSSTASAATVTLGSGALQPESNQGSKLASVVDSMGVMKNS